LSGEKSLVIDVSKEEHDLEYYKAKLAEQVQATREILGNFQTISRRSKIREGMTERYKEEISKHKEYLNHLLEQQSAALTGYKGKIVDINREKLAFRNAYRELRQEFETYQNQAQQYYQQLSQNNEQVEKLKVYMKKLEDFIKLQYEKKEFYKSELRKRVAKEQEFRERENVYLHQIEQYEQAILRIRKNSNDDSNDNQEEEQQEEEENNSEEKQENNQLQEEDGKQEDGKQEDGKQEEEEKIEKQQKLTPEEEPV